MKQSPTDCAAWNPARGSSLNFGIYATPYGRLMDCARRSISEVATVAGVNHNDISSAPATDQSGFLDECFGQRATNESMWLGAGIDIVIENVKVDDVSVEIPIIGEDVTLIGGSERTLYTRVPLEPQLAARSVPVLDPLFGAIGIEDEEVSVGEVVVFFSEQEGVVSIPEEMKSRFRRDLAALADHMLTRMKDAPDATDVASAPPSMIGVAHNGDASFAHSDIPADYLDQAGEYTPDFHLPTDLEGDAEASKQAAVARLYSQAFATEWCQSVEELELDILRYNAETHATDVACEVCAEIASRHIRLGTDESNYDNYNIPVCDLLSVGADFVYLDVEPVDSLGWLDVGEIWCGCQEPPENTEDEESFVDEPETDTEDDTNDPDDSDCTGFFAGRVVDAITGAAVEGADIDYSGVIDGLVPSDPDGTFLSEELPCGGYQVIVAADGYLPATLTVDIAQDGSTTQLVELHALDEECGAQSAEVTGWIVDGITGYLVVGAIVELREGADAAASDAVFASAVTDNDGVYNFQDVPGGYYTVSASAPGYDDSGLRQISICATPEVEFQQDIHLLPNAQRAYSFVLNWVQPEDLDLHLLLPDGNEVSFGDCAGSLEEYPFARLDVDHQMADGPEAITISDVMDGVYTLYVHNFSAQNFDGESFEGSGAQLTVYKNSVPTLTFPVPFGDAYFWDVLEFEGSVDYLDVRTLGVLTNDRSNPYGEEYTDTCTP
jgi:hypothetical protein